MTSDALTISVVICTCSEARWEYLIKAVDSVQSQTVLPLDIIVVVDHNPGLATCARAQLAGAVVVEKHEPRGLSGARNSGIAAARGEVIAFLDDDAIASPEWLEQLSAGYTDDRVVGVGGAIEPLWLNGRPSWFPDEFQWVLSCTYRGLPLTSTPVRNLIGANMSFRREVFDTVRGFRNGVGQVGASMLRCDDTEFCIRLRQRWPDKIILYRPQAHVYHQVPLDRTRWAYFCSRCYTEGLAKALVSRLVGSLDGLSSERTYIVRVLPQGVVHDLTDVVVRRDPAGLPRAGAIVAGVAMTVAGYMVGRIASSMPASSY
jgi:glycosyltransferase involved in cell wall biosynthesis